jgi:hypothetical protein
MTQYQVGQEVCVVTGYGQKSHVSTEKIAAVGRKWVTLAGFFEGQRIALGDSTMAVEIPSYGRVGRCYLTEQQYIDERALENAWDKFRRDVSAKWAPPDAVTVEWIAEARKTLGLDGSAA